MTNKKRILIVEDDEVMAPKLVTFLEERGYVTEHVTNARAACVSLGRATNRFDIVVCDNNFLPFAESEWPEPLGLDMLHMIRLGTVDGYERTPFILHTGDEGTSLRQRVAEDGGVYCHKRSDFSFYGLLVLIEEQLASVAA